MAESEKKKYRKNYLSMVVCRLNFDTVAEMDDTLMKAYREALGEDYSQLASVNQKGIIIQNDGSDIHTEIDNKDVWQIQSANGTHVITIAKDSFAIEFSQYIIFREYIEIVSAAQSLFLEKFPQIKQINRLGLRYINQIKIDTPNFEWSTYINSALTQPLGFVEKSSILRSMHSMVINHDEDTRLNFNFGLFNKYFPAPITDNEFILDFDAYTPGTVQPSVVRSLIENFNKVIAIYFELSITDNLRQEMEVIIDESGN